MNFESWWWQVRYDMKNHWRRRRWWYGIAFVLLGLWLTQDYWTAALRQRDLPTDSTALIQRAKSLWHNPSLGPGRPSAPALPALRGHGPKTDPAGRPWPGKSGYLAGSAVLRTGGMSYVEADNSGNATDVFAKLYWIDLQQPLAVRTIFVRGGEKFKMKELPAGRYEIRYQELETGILYASQPVEVTVKKKQGGSEEFLSWTVGLYPAVAGDAPRRIISPGEFAQ